MNWLQLEILNKFYRTLKSYKKKKANCFLFLKRKNSTNKVIVFLFLNILPEFFAFDKISDCKCDCCANDCGNKRSQIPPLAVSL